MRAFLYKVLATFVASRFFRWALRKICGPVADSAAEKFGYEVLGPMFVGVFAATGSQSQLLEDSFQRVLAAVAKGVNKRLDEDDPGS